MKSPFMKSFLKCIFYRPCPHHGRTRPRNCPGKCWSVIRSAQLKITTTQQNMNSLMKEPVSWEGKECPNPLSTALNWLMPRRPWWKRTDCHWWKSLKLNWNWLKVEKSGMCTFIFVISPLPGLGLVKLAFFH